MSINIEFPNFYEGVKNPFRWYLNPEKRNKHRNACNGECAYKLFASANTLLPFQVYAPFAPPHTLTWNIYNSEGTMIWSPDESLLQLVKVDEFWYYIFKGDDIGVILPNGYYTSEIIIDGSGDTVTWYSEDFWVYNGCPEQVPFERPFQNFDACLDLSLQPDGFTCVDSSACAPDEISIIELDSATIQPFQFYTIIVNVQSISGTNALFLIVVGDGDSYEITEPGVYEVPLLSGVGGIITFGVRTGTSVCFFVQGVLLAVIDPKDCVTVLEWWQDCGVVGEILYGTTGYKNKLILPSDVEVVNVSPKLTREGHENGHHDFIPSFQKRTTEYTLALGKQPPFIIEALHEMAIHENVQLNLLSELGIDLIKNVTPRYNYDEGGGCFANVYLDYELDDTTVVTNCCDSDIDESPCIDNNIIGDDWELGFGWQVWEESFGCPGLDSSWFCMVPGDSTTIQNNNSNIVSGKKYKVTINVACLFGSDASDGFLIHFGGSTLQMLHTSFPDPTTTKQTIFEVVASVDGELKVEAVDPVDTSGCIKIQACEIRLS